MLLPLIPVPRDTKRKKTHCLKATLSNTYLEHQLDCKLSLRQKLWVIVFLCPAQRLTQNIYRIIIGGWIIPVQV